MKSYLLSAQMLGALSILFVVGMAILIPVLRMALRRPQLPREIYSKLALDLTTLIPVAALVWNLLVYCISHTPYAFAPSGSKDALTVTFADAVHGTGELAIIIAALVVMFRLIASIWSDIVH